MANNSPKSVFGIKSVLIFFLISILIFTLFRAGLVFWKFPDCKDNLFDIFLYGLRYDISINCTMFSPAFLYCIFKNYFCKNQSHLLNLIERFYLALVVTVQFCVELSTPAFILEYGVRPNHLYVEYLIYPKEVLSTLANGHLLESILCLALSGLMFFSLLKISKRFYSNQNYVSKLKNTIVLILTLVLIPLGIRGTLSHKPLNPSNASFSQSPLVNTIPTNSSFRVFFALRHLGDDSVKSSEIYAFDTINNVLNNLNDFSQRELPSVIDETCPINQVITPAITTQKKRNVVVILEESLGARYVQSLGGNPITPNLEKLKEQGWWFERLYATGHRSVRGIEAVTASYPPSPLASQVKLDHSETMTTMAAIYKALGYNTSFIYGGESHFDNMRSYFLNNGVEEVTEQKDYDDPKFVASWGVSDEDLFARANQNFIKMDKENTPFCSLVFSSSFHDPFDIPEGKVDINGVKTNDPKRLTAAKYADYALGKFFEMAQKEDYYKNTVFLIIADHDSRVRGIDAFPFTNYSIPALIISPDMAPKVDKRVVSQIDMLPTLLSLTGVSGQFPLIGQDLTKDNIKERALVSYNEIFGSFKDNKLVLLAPGAGVEYKIEQHNKLGSTLQARDYSKEISYLNLGLTIYENNLNRFSCVKDLKQN